MKYDKIRNIKKGQVFATKGAPRKLYVCVRTRIPTETYYGYILPYPAYKGEEVIKAKNKYTNQPYNFYPNYQGHYVEFNPDNKIIIYEEGEVMLMNLQS